MHTGCTEPNNGRPGTIDLQQFKQKSSQFPDFSFAKFESDRAANPSSFHDVFGDGKLLIQARLSAFLVNGVRNSLLVGTTLKQTAY